ERYAAVYGKVRHDPMRLFGKPSFIKPIWRPGNSVSRQRSRSPYDRDDCGRECDDRTVDTRIVMRAEVRKQEPTEVADGVVQSRDEYALPRVVVEPDHRTR